MYYFAKKEINSLKSFPAWGCGKAVLDKLAGEALWAAEAYIFNMSDKDRTATAINAWLGFDCKDYLLRKHDLLLDGTDVYVAVMRRSNAKSLDDFTDSQLRRVSQACMRYDGLEAEEVEELLRDQYWLICDRDKVWSWMCENDVNFVDYTMHCVVDELVVLKIKD